MRVIVYFEIMKSSFCFFSCCWLMAILVSGCKEPTTPPSTADAKRAEVELVILGIAQDAGYPQSDCKKSCCKDVWMEPSRRKMVSCLGLRDRQSGKAWMLDATPDFRDQLQILTNTPEHNYSLDGIFLTHAHMGHYTGLMHLGREAMGAQAIKVHAMPAMQEFLADNGPWSQLVSLENIRLMDLQTSQPVVLAEGRIRVTPLLVPHRDEFSETVGYKIGVGDNSYLFIPDIDKWAKWDRDIIALIKEVDLAFLDGTFYRNGEIWGRDMSQIPHPFIEESMALFSDLSLEDRAKVHFIHLNHTNPLLNRDSDEYLSFIKSGFRLAEEGEVLAL